MRRLWIAFGILAAAAVLCVTSLLSHRTTISRLQAELTAAEQAVRAGDMTAAFEKTVLFQAHCAKADRSFDVLSRHEQNLPLQQSSYLLYPLLESGALEDFLLEVAHCRFCLEELARTEEPSFSNIF